MAKSGLASYDSGMRGSEEPKRKPRGEHKRKVKRLTIEAAKTGHIVTVERHPKKAAKANEPVSLEEPEKHAHGSPEEAKAHVGKLMDQMSESDDDGDEGY